MKKIITYVFLSSFIISSFAFFGSANATTMDPIFTASFLQQLEALSQELRELQSRVQFNISNDSSSLSSVNSLLAQVSATFSGTLVPPTNFTAKDTSNSSSFNMKFNFYDNATDEDGYLVFYPDGSIWGKVASVKANKGSLTPIFSSIDCTKSFSGIYVKAYRGDLNSAYEVSSPSNVATIPIPSVCGAADFSLSSSPTSLSTMLPDSITGSKSLRFDVTVTPSSYINCPSVSGYKVEPSSSDNGNITATYLHFANGDWCRGTLYVNVKSTAKPGTYNFTVSAQNKSYAKTKSIPIQIVINAIPGVGDLSAPTNLALFYENTTTTQSTYTFTFTDNATGEDGVVFYYGDGSQMSWSSGYSTKGSKVGSTAVSFVRGFNAGKFECAKAKTGVYMKAYKGSYPNGPFTLSGVSRTVNIPIPSSCTTITQPSISTIPDIVTSPTISSPSVTISSTPSVVVTTPAITTQQTTQTTQQTTQTTQQTTQTTQQTAIVTTTTGSATSSVVAPPVSTTTTSIPTSSISSDIEAPKNLKLESQTLITGSDGKKYIFTKMSFTHSANDISGYYLYFADNTPWIQTSFSNKETSNSRTIQFASTCQTNPTSGVYLRAYKQLDTNGIQFRYSPSSNAISVPWPDICSSVDFSLVPDPETITVSLPTNYYSPKQVKSNVSFKLSDYLSRELLTNHKIVGESYLQDGAIVAEYAQQSAAGRVLVISVRSDAKPGTYDFTISGSYGNLTRSAVVHLNVVSATQTQQTSTATKPTSSTTKPTGSTVGSKEVITVTSPTATDVWRIGRRQEMKWISTGDKAQYVSIYLVNASGQTVSTISNIAYNDGDFRWSVRSNVLPMGGYRIKIQSYGNSAEAAFSSPFVIAR